MTLLDDLRAEERRLTDAIDAAYWRFTRCARAKPPSLVCPEAYDRRNVVRDLIRDAVRAASPAPTPETPDVR